MMNRIIMPFAEQQEFTIKDTLNKGSLIDKSLLMDIPYSAHQHVILV